jgi:hypothetical protein
MLRARSKAVVQGMMVKNQAPVASIAYIQEGSALVLDVQCPSQIGTPCLDVCSSGMHGTPRMHALPRTRQPLLAHHLLRTLRSSAAASQNLCRACAERLCRAQPVQSACAEPLLQTLMRRSKSAD